MATSKSAPAAADFSIASDAPSRNVNSAPYICLLRTGAAGQSMAEAIRAG